MQGMVLLDQLQVESDAHAVDEDDALIKKLLIGDLGIHELTKSGARADEFDCFRSAFCPWSQLVQNRKVKELELQIRRDFLR